MSLSRMASHLLRRPQTIQRLVMPASTVVTTKESVNRSSLSKEDLKKMAKSNYHPIGKHRDFFKTKDITYVSLGKEDLNEVIPLIRDHFVPFQPVVIGLSATYNDLKDVILHLINNALKDGLSIGARNNVGELIGMLIVEKKTKQDAFFKDLALLAEGNRKARHFLKVRKHAVGDYDIFSEYGVDEVVYGSRLTVHSDYRRQGIDAKLFMLSDQQAVEKGFGVHCGLSSDIKSLNAAKKCGYVPVRETQYKIFDFLNLKAMGNNTSMQLVVKKCV